MCYTQKEWLILVKDLFRRNHVSDAFEYNTSVAECVNAVKYSRNIRQCVDAFEY